MKLQNKSHEKNIKKKETGSAKWHFLSGPMEGSFLELLQLRQRRNSTEAAIIYRYMEIINMIVYYILYSYIYIYMHFFTIVHLEYISECCGGKVSARQTE